MSRCITIASCVLLSFVAGCDYYNNSWMKEGERLEGRRLAIHASARNSVAFPREFELLFSGGRTSASESALGWSYNVEVGLYGRYHLKGSVPLTVDTNTMTVIRADSPEIYVREYARIIPAGGNIGGSATFSTNQIQLRAAEWRKLVDSRGDFSAVGYLMVTNMPLPHFGRMCRFPGSVNR